MKPPKTSAPQPGTRLGLRSRPPAKSDFPFYDNPDRLLRKASQPKGLRSRPPAESDFPFYDNPERLLRKASQPKEPKETAPALDRPRNAPCERPDVVVESIEAPFTEGYQSLDCRTSEEDSDEEASLYPQDADPEQAFNRSWGYLPPLNEETIAIINAIIANPNMAKEAARIGPEDSERFPQGLKFRNVILTESRTHDAQAVYIRSLASTLSAPCTSQETNLELEAQKQLWTLDRARLDEGSNEALFQRTLMMSLIARDVFIYGKNADHQRCLDFSVEELWNCPPMPSRAYEAGTPFLTQPKPDLAVCFRRETTIPDNLWYTMPLATERLARFENGSEKERIFHFFTIEAKKSGLSANDIVAKRQSLNNASQALHNMYEFFQDAGPEHRAHFFEKVRFFSVVGSAEGLTIRIHRATEEQEDGSGLGFVVRGYPLRFEYEEYLRIGRDGFERDTVIAEFEKILIGYGVNQLQILLRNAAEAIMCNLNAEELNKRQHPNFYRHGQTELESKKKLQTPASRRALSMQSQMSVVQRSQSTQSQMSIVRSAIAMGALSRDVSEAAASADMQLDRSVTPTLARGNQKRKRKRNGSTPQ